MAGPTRKMLPGSNEAIPLSLPVLPLRHSVLLPGVALPIDIERKKDISLAKYAYTNKQFIGVVTQREPDVLDPGAAEMYTFGTVGRIISVLDDLGDVYPVVLEGLVRFRVLEWLPQSIHHRARVEVVSEQPAANPSEAEGLSAELKRLVLESGRFVPGLAESTIPPSRLVNLALAHLDVGVPERQALLETVDLVERLKRAIELVRRQPPKTSLR